MGGSNVAASTLSLERFRQLIKTGCLAIVVVVLLITAPLRSQAASKSETLPLLAGTNTVSGSDVVMMKVHLSTPATLSSRIWNNPDVKFRGRGSTAGFALVEANRSQPATLFGLRVPFCNASCPQRRSRAVVMSTGDILPVRRLQAGDYHLFLIADAATRVTFRLSGLSGSAQFAPETHARGSVQELVPQLDEPGLKTIAYGRAPFTFENGGFSMTAVQWMADDVASARHEHCVGPLVDEDPGSKGPVPPCPVVFARTLGQGESSWWSWQMGPMEPRDMTMFSLHWKTVGPGSFDRVFGYSLQGLVRSRTFLTVTLQYPHTDDPDRISYFVFGDPTQPSSQEQSRLASPAPARCGLPANVLGTCSV